jgi:hypothetical protein
MKIGRGNRRTLRKPAPALLCPPQIPLNQTRSRTRAAAVGSQRLTALAMARPSKRLHVIKMLVCYGNCILIGTMDCRTRESNSSTQKSKFQHA